MLDHSSASGPALRRRPSPRVRNGTVQMSGPLLYYNGFDKDPIALERALRDYFRARRPVSIDRLGRKYPETIVLEVAQVAATLYNESQRYKDKRRPSWADTLIAGPAAWLATELGRDDDYAGHADAVKRFGDYYKRLRAELDAQPPTAVYAKNAEAWAEFLRLAVRLGVAADHPPPARSVISSLAHSVEELPRTLSKAAEAVSNAALAPVRRGLGDLLRAVAVPVAVGGAAIVGVVLLTRQPRPTEGGSS